MRVKSNPWFAVYLLRIVGGSEEDNGDGKIYLPDDIYIPQTEEDTDLDTLNYYIFLALNANMSNKSYITSRAILSPWNDYLDMIYMKMISHFQEDEMVYHNFDSAVDDPQNY